MPEEMAQSLTTLAALSEDQCLVPSTYTDGSQLPVAPARGTQHYLYPPLASTFPQTHANTHTHIHACTQIKLK